VDGVSREETMTDMVAYIASIIWPYVVVAVGICITAMIILYLEAKALRKRK